MSELRTNEDSLKHPESLSFDYRKQIAAYYTKPLAAYLVTALTITSGNEIILDPACGSGQLLLTALKKLKMIKNKNNNQVDEKQLINQLYGIELTQDASELAKKALIAQTNKSVRPNIFTGDAFSFLTSDKIKKAGINVLIANPPFTKKQRLTESYRNNIAKILNVTSKSMGLHFYFLEYSRKILPEKGRCSLILPLTFSYSDTGRSIVEEFLDSFDINFLIASEIETSFSKGSNLEEIILVATKKEKKGFNPNFKTPCVTFKVPLTKKIIKDVINWLINRGIEIDSRFYRISLVKQENLRKLLHKNGWGFLYVTKLKEKIMDQIKPNLINFDQEKKLKKNRGINAPIDFFFLPNKYWNIQSQEKNSIQLILSKDIHPKFNKSRLIIPRSCIVPLIRKPEYYKTKSNIEKSTKLENYFLRLPEGNKELPPDVISYIRFGKQIGANQRSNTRKLKDNWIHLGEKSLTPSHLFLTFKWDPRYRAFLVNYSSEAVVASQAFWQIQVLRLKNKTNTEIFLAAWYNSTIGMAFLFDKADIQRRVWRQLAGKQLESILAPPLDLVDKLSKAEILILKNFLNMNMSDNLLNQLTECRILLQAGDKNLRIMIDIFFLDLLNNEPQMILNNIESVTYEIILEKFYLEFIQELQL
ncbi:MAG: N-6 DNA methylase [Candidatus Hodarchaeales archaeon]|jgi:tRNA1(Val) A37 N6-methylase TrmN6